MRSDVCPWLTPCGYTRKVRPHLPQRYLCTCTCWYTVSLSAFPTDWCIWTCLLPQPSYTHSLGSLISFGSTFGNNNCKRIADVLPLFSPLYFTPLLPLDEQSRQSREDLSGWFQANLVGFGSPSRSLRAGEDRA